MGTLAFIVELAKALGWPLATLIIVFAVRKPFLKLLEGVHLRQIKVGAVEALFGRLQKSKDRSSLPLGPTPTSPPQLTTGKEEKTPEKDEKTPAPPAVPDASPPVPQEIFTISPASAIVSSFQRLEAALWEAYQRVADPKEKGPEFRNVPRMVWVLGQKGILTTQLEEQIETLYRIKQTISTTPAEAEQTTIQQAAEYDEVVKSAIWKISTAASVHLQSKSHF